MKNESTRREFRNRWRANRHARAERRWRWREIRRLGREIRRIGRLIDLGRDAPLSPRDAFEAMAREQLAREGRR
jgi:hypothetical protein